jgi:hypothetical protein
LVSKAPTKVLRPKPAALKAIKVERCGGLAGFGLPGSHLRSCGVLDYAALDAQTQRAVDQLFGSQQRARRQVGSGATRDGFRYRISRGTAPMVETVEVSEADVPAVISACVKDEFA